ncbi:hypothetical protein PSU4_54160 [Pseudonocardia sulfidoxydans NBRC 16205]|uniref:ParB-like N-terminal domain-containing protein n=1 Tax=Pseudonocardia sulfidoxydans NBRC 16205 TaxID=1223511 RepID=A0A511DNR8_9PSEU|nr:ParB/RepB/Spo0J family partition protein [Pseudonocardia sulfidoxydans]GEL26462.1 hypothetical protein PSU4_54160 [Pseudonocardia sulfidoxydans NBRC 16205]
MGKRVNLAELAQEEVPDSYSLTPPADARWSTSTRGRTVELDSATLAVGDIALNPFNERDPSDDEGEEFDQLVATIRQHGVLQPIVVCSAQAFGDRFPSEHSRIGDASWVALIGNRRLRASIAAGQARVPALVNDERLASMHEVMLIENSHRKDLSPLREAAAMQCVLTAEKISQRELAARIGRTNGYVSQRVVLLGLIPALKDALQDGRLKLERARELGALPTDEQEQIAADGPPYRRKAERAGHRTRRTIAAATPADAAASIRKVFSADELAELIRLLSTQRD